MQGQSASARENTDSVMHIPLSGEALTGAYTQLVDDYAWLNQRYDLLKRRYEYMHGFDIEILSDQNLQQLREDLEAGLQRVQTQQHYNDASKEVAMKFKGFVCPIGNKLMKDPVIAADGHSYDKENIELFLNLWAVDKQTILSPKTNKPFQHIHLIPNHALKISIDEALEHCVHK